MGGISSIIIAYVRVATLRIGTLFISSLAAVRGERGKRFDGWHNTSKHPPLHDLILGYNVLSQDSLSCSCLAKPIHTSLEAFSLPQIYPLNLSIQTCAPHSRVSVKLHT